MLEFLSALSPSAVPQSWVGNILKTLPEDDLLHGFSEYHTYVSWVKQTHPETQYILGKKTWMRQPIGGEYGVRLAALLSGNGLCCPSTIQHWIQWLAGYHYYGFEIGHHQFCGWEEIGSLYGINSSL
jgi:uncharacterized short protein YbdD (DUF466 family)